MIESYQERAALQADTAKKTTTATVATVGAVYDDGITLILPGENTAGVKRYPYNAAIAFKAGQRVHLSRESGTIIVEYPLDHGTADGYAKASDLGDVTQLTTDAKIVVPAVNELRSKLQELWSSIYPVGSIYMSLEKTDPGTLFGGDWERIKDRFLLSSGNSYAAGATGGEVSHTLTDSELPDFSSPVNFYANKPVGAGDGNVPVDFGLTWDSRTSASTAVTANHTGGGQPHNNMPPYLAVYIWKRVA